MKSLCSRLVLAVGLVLLPVASLPAQGVTAGFKGGLNGADVSFDPEVDTGLRVGFIGGGALAFGLHPSFAIQGEVLFSQKGTEVDDEVEGVSATLGVNYIEIPLLAKVMIPAGVVTPIFYAGPAVAFEASCSLSGDIDGIEVDIDCDDPLADVQRKKTDFGLVGGAGLEIGTGPVAFTVEGRYNLGLVNIDDTGDPGSSAKLRTFSLLVGLLFKLPT